MTLDTPFFDELLEKAKESPRLRINYDLRNSINDTSQRMLNIILPGSIMEIHRHRDTNEIICVLHGSIRETFFNNEGDIIKTVILKYGSDVSALVIPAGTWHKLDCFEPCVLLTTKDGKYLPLEDEDLLRRER